MKWLFISNALLLLAACSSGNGASSEAPTEEYAQELARSAARAVSLVDHNDTLALQQAIVDAHATRSDLILHGHQECAYAFDKTFKEELRKVDPQVAEEVFQ